MELDSLDMAEGLEYFCSELKATPHPVLGIPPPFSRARAYGCEAHRMLEGRVGALFQAGNIAILHGMNATHICV